MRLKHTGLAVASCFGFVGCDLATPQMTEQVSLYNKTQIALDLYGPIKSGNISTNMALLLRRMNRATLIDVRRPSEWKETGVAEGAVGITLQDADFLDQVLAATDGDKSRPIALICQSGNRSSQAQEKLEAAGFTTVYNVAGGTLDWKAKGLPTEDCRTC